MFRFSTFEIVDEKGGSHWIHFRLGQRTSLEKEDRFFYTQFACLHFSEETPCLPVKLENVLFRGEYEVDFSSGVKHFRPYELSNTLFCAECDLIMIIGGFMNAYDPKGLYNKHECDCCKGEI